MCRHKYPSLQLEIAGLILDFFYTLWKRLNLVRLLRWTGRGEFGFEFRAAREIGRSRRRESSRLQATASENKPDDNHSRGEAALLASRRIHRNTFPCNQEGSNDHGVTKYKQRDYRLLNCLIILLIREAACLNKKPFRFISRHSAVNPNS